METVDRVFRFGPYVLDARRRQLLRGGEPLKLYPKEFDTLLALVERRGRVVEKDELLNAVWLGAAVEEGNLTTHVSHLRKLLGGAGTNRDYIATIPGRGYEFVGQVTEESPRAPARSEAPPVETPRFTARRGFKLTLAAMAASVLIGLAFVASRNPRNTRPSFQRLTFGNGTIWSARFAPDGQTVLYGAAWNGRPITPYLTRLGSTESTALGYPGDVLAISASGDMLVLLDRVLVAGWGSSGTLAQVSLAGGAPREIVKGVRAADWSPDGEYAIVSSAGGIARDTLQFPAGNPIYQVEGFIKQPRISRTGDAVAILQFSGGDESVEIVTRLGERQTLARNLTGVTGLAWSPTGREIFFTVTSQGKTELHAVTTSGAQRRVAEAAGEWKLHDIAPDGRVLMTLDNRHGYTMGAAAGEATERDLSWLDRSIAIDLSADGRLLLLGEIGAGGGETGSAYLRRMDGSPAVRLGEGQPAALSPDGKWAIVNNQGSPERLVLVPTSASARDVRGEPQSLENGAIVDYYGVRFLPDGHQIIFTAIAPGRGRNIYIQDTRTRSAPLEWHAPPWGTAFFPDGQRYVARSRRPYRYCVFDMNGAELQVVPNIANDELVIQTGADGQSVFVLAGHLRGPMTMTIDRVDLSTGHRTRWKDVVVRDPAGVMHTHSGSVPFLMTHDGSTYVYNYQRVLSTLYVVENLR